MRFEGFLKGIALATGIAGVHAPELAHAESPRGQGEVQVPHEIQERMGSFTNQEGLVLKTELQNYSDDQKVVATLCAHLSTEAASRAIEPGEGLERLFDLMAQMDLEESPFVLQEASAPLDILLGKISKVPNMEAGVNIAEENDRTRNDPARLGKLGDQQVTLHDISLAKSTVFDKSGNAGEEITLGLRFNGNYL